MASINTNLNKYYTKNTEERFNKIFVQIVGLVNEKELIEAVTNSIDARNYFHRSTLFWQMGRMLEASDSLKKHLLKNPLDLKGWMQLQFISAKRGDLRTSVTCFEHIKKLRKEDDLLISYICHLLAQGDRLKALDVMHYLIDKDMAKKFNIHILLNVAIVNEDWKSVSYTLNLLSSKEEMIPLLHSQIMRDVITKRLIYVIKERIKTESDVQ